MKRRISCSLAVLVLIRFCRLSRIHISVSSICLSHKSFAFQLTSCISSSPMHSGAVQCDVHQIHSYLSPCRFFSFLCSPWHSGSWLERWSSIFYSFKSTTNFKVPCLMSYLVCQGAWVLGYLGFKIQQYSCTHFRLYLFTTQLPTYGMFAPQYLYPKSALPHVPFLSWSICLRSSVASRAKTKLFPSILVFALHLF